MANQQAVLALTVSGAIAFGGTLALLGRLKLRLAKQLDVSEARGMGLRTALNLLLIPLMLLSGVLVDYVGTRGIMIVGSFLLAGSLLLGGVHMPPTRALLTLLLGALGGAAVCVASVVLMPLAYFPGEYPASLNLGFVFFALGALVTAPMTDILLENAGRRRTLAVFALLCLVPGFVAVVVGNLVPPPAENPNLVRLLESEPVWLAGLVFLFYAPLEGMVTTWTTSNLNDEKERARGVRLLAGFWLAFVVSRLLTALLQHSGVLGAWSHSWMLIVPAALVAVVVGNLAGTAQLSKAWSGMLLLGLLLGPVLPTLLGTIFQQYPQAEGTSFGLVFAIGSLGSLVVSPAVTFDQVLPPGKIVRVPLLLALLLTVATLVFGLLVAPVP